MEDPGDAYHKVSKLPFKYNVSRKKILFPGFRKKIKYLNTVKLPQPDKKLFRFSLPETLEDRRSIREYENREVELVKLSTLLYYSVGYKESEWGYPIRMFPTAGALNSPEIYLSVRKVENLEAGIYHYDVYNHVLGLIKRGDISRDLYSASLQQECILNAPLVIIVSVVYKRTTSKYGIRGYRYVLLDSGHLGMNIYLVSVSLGLGTVCVGAFEDEPIEEILGLDAYEYITSLYPIGYPKR